MTLPTPRRMCSVDIYRDFRDFCTLYGWTGEHWGVFAFAFLGYLRWA